MTIMVNASPLPSAFDIRPGVALRMIKDLQTQQDRAKPVTSLVRHPVTKLREAIRGISVSGRTTTNADRQSNQRHRNVNIPGGRIDPFRLHTAFPIQRQLAT
jgi:hypothetical protein